MKYSIKFRHLVYVLIFGILTTGCHKNESVREYLITDYGALSDGETVNTKAIQSAIDEATNHGGGIVVIPKGEYLSGTIYLKDNVTLKVEKDGVLKGSTSLADYPIHELSTIRSYTERYTKKAFVYAEGAKNIGLIGEGTIDGNSINDEFAAVKKISVKPLGIKLVSCENVLVEDLHIQNAGLWLQHYLNCEDLTIRNIKGFNHGFFTNDGLDIDGCRNVLVEGIEIDSHDDALVFKSTGPAKCENIVVRNCTLRTHIHPIKFGTETTGGFYNINISDIDIKPSMVKHKKTGTKWPLNSCMALEITDGGSMEKISISNIKADSVYGPIFIKLGNRARKHRDDAAVPQPGSIKDVVISDVEIKNAIKFSSSVTGFPENYVEDVTLRNINIHYSQAPELDEIFEGDVPENEELYPEITMFSKKEDKRYYLPTHGLFARHVNGLTIENFNVITAEGEIREKFQFINVKDLKK